MSDKPEIQGLRDVREALDGASLEGLRVIIEDLAIQLAEQRLAGRNLVNACRVALDFHRAGCFPEATEVLSRVVAISDEALAKAAATAAGGPLAGMQPMGRA